MAKTYTITLIPGDGTGPEITEVVKKVVDATGIKINWDIVEAGESAPEPLSDKVLESIRKNKVALKGPITTPIGKGYRSINVALRQLLDLYACVRPCKIYKGVKTRYENVDIVIVRENTEDLYAGVEFALGSDEMKEIMKLSKGKIKNESAISIKPISKEASERIIKFAFEYSIKHNRKKVTAITKANIMKYTDGLFFDCGRKVAKDYPQIQYEEKLVDNMAMQLVQKPELYDVLALPNLYGDIISDLCAGLVGGLGVAPGINYGDKIALFEAVHGSAPKYKGMNKVNPTAMLLSAELMLEHIGETKKAEMLEKAIAEVIAEGKSVTYDLGGKATTTEMGTAIIEKIGTHPI